MALKDLKEGVPVKLSKLNSEEHSTTPPARFSEVKLVAELESRSIGRPSTYSSIVSLIQDRGYVAKKGTQLYPTALGFAVARLLAAKLPVFTAYDYTAKMEDELEEIAEGKQQREKFLASFWNGADGFNSLLTALKESVDFKEIEKYTTIQLHNGYSVRFSKFGTFIQDDNGKANEKGYLPSVRIDDDADIWEYKTKEACVEAFANAATKVESRELGVLEAGEYVGWSLEVKDGRFGPYIQAMHPDHIKAILKGKKPAGSVPKPVNHKLPEGATVELVVMKDIAELFAEVKLPRWSPDGKWLVGIGKRGAYIGLKSSPKGRPVFRSLKPELDPKKVSFQEVEEIWREAVAEADAAKKAKEAKKRPVKKSTAKNN